MINKIKRLTSAELLSRMKKVGFGISDIEMKNGPEFKQAELFNSKSVLSPYVNSKVVV